MTTKLHAHVTVSLRRDSHVVLNERGVNGAVAFELSTRMREILTVDGWTVSSDRDEARRHVVHLQRGLRTGSIITAQCAEECRLARP